MLPVKQSLKSEKRRAEDYRSLEMILWSSALKTEKKSPKAIWNNVVKIKYPVAFASSNVTPTNLKITVNS